MVSLEFLGAVNGILGKWYVDCMSQIHGHFEGATSSSRISYNCWKLTPVKDKKWVKISEQEMTARKMSVMG